MAITQESVTLPEVSATPRHQYVAFLVMMPRAATFGGILLVLYLSQAASVNAVLAGFNMIPVMPLDGAKVWAWNKAAYVGIAAIAIGLFVVTVFAPF